MMIYPNVLFLCAAGCAIGRLTRCFCVYVGGARWVHELYSTEFIAFSYICSINCINYFSLVIDTHFVCCVIVKLYAQEGNKSCVSFCNDQSVEPII